MPSSLVLSDPRSLLGDGLSPARPDMAESVAACFPREHGLRLVLVAEKHISQYSAWVWRGNDGQAYFSKQFASGRALAWKPGATVERVLRANPSFRKEKEIKMPLDINKEKRSE